jgi:hypothetical protein
MSTITGTPTTPSRMLLPPDWSLLAALLIQRLMNFVERKDLGVVLGPDGALRILPQRMRIPAVSFLGWHHFPERCLPFDRYARQSSP